MTAPFAPPPKRFFHVFLAGALAVAVAAPFARRDDAIGWIAFLTIAAAAVGLWGVLTVGFVRGILRRRERGPGAE
jgi:nitrate reductase NapE component